MATPGEPEGLGAALFQISEHAERIGGLDEREARHYQEIGGRLSDLGTRVTGMGGTLTDQAEILAGLEGLDEQVASLTTRLDEVLPEDQADPAFYLPIPAPRWWVLQGEPREQAIRKLRAWVGQVYRPGYGVISASLGRCWESHQHCLFTLDWLSELWSVLYLQSKRSASTLAGQGEWQTRLLPAAAEQMAVETSRCDHDQAQRRPASGARNGTPLRSAS
jgi:hypothetical protein